MAASSRSSFFLFLFLVDFFPIEKRLARIFRIFFLQEKAGPLVFLSSLLSVEEKAPSYGRNQELKGGGEEDFSPEEM